MKCSITTDVILITSIVMEHFIYCYEVFQYLPPARLF